MLKPPVWALISSTSPAKWSPGTSLLSRVLGLISLRLTPPLVTKDLARDIFPVTGILRALMDWRSCSRSFSVSCLTFQDSLAQEILPSVLEAKFLKHFSRIFPDFLLEMQSSPSQKVEAKHLAREPLYP